MLLRAPESWPQPVVAAVAMVLLAVLDLGGALAAKEALERRSPALAVLGAVLFLLVFWVYISSLTVAELSAVTFGWIVVLQIGVVLADRFRYGVVPAPGTWLAIAVLLAAQSYLVLSPTSTTPTGTTPTMPRQGVPAGARPAPGPTVRGRELLLGQGLPARVPLPRGARTDVTPAPPSGP